MTRDREIRAATDLYALVSQYVPLRRRGSVAVGKCPFHGPDKNPSFRVNLAGKHAGRWRCWTESIGGDAIDFLAKIEGITHFEALKRLASDAGIKMDAPAESQSERARRREEKVACLQWYRLRWSAFRRELNRMMANGPPSSLREYRRANYLGQVMRWIEQERGTEAGMRVYRMST